MQRLGRDLAESVGQTGARLDDLREESARAASELHQELLKQSKALGDDFVRRLGEQSAATRAEFQGLRASSVDRSALSTLLAQLALQLSDDDHSSE